VDLGRDDAPRLGGRAERAQAHVGGERPGAKLRRRLHADPLHVLEREPRRLRTQGRRKLTLAGEDEAHRPVAKTRRRGQHRVGAVERAPLPVLEHDERLALSKGAGGAARLRLRQRPDRHDRETLPRDTEPAPVEDRLLPRVRKDEVGAAEGDTVGHGKRSPERRALGDQTPVGAERVAERHQGVEDEPRPAHAGDDPGEGHDQVARVADDDGIGGEATAVLRRKPRVGGEHAARDARGARPRRHRRRVQSRQRGAELMHRHASLAQPGQQDRVARVIGIVRPEVGDGPGHGPGHGSARGITSRRVPRRP